MLDHVSIAVRDLESAVAFYDSVMAALGHQRVYLTERAAGSGQRNSAGDDSHTYLTIVVDTTARPADQHWAFRASSRAAVDRFHRAATESGGRDDGGVGVRPEYHPSYYAAFVLDPSGNRLEAVCHRR